MLTTWLKTTDTDVSPLQTYCLTDSDPRLNFNGSRKRFTDNYNYYDHNILGLSNRIAVSGRVLTPDPTSGGLSKSRSAFPNVNNSETKNSKISYKQSPSMERNDINPYELCSGCYNVQVSEEKHSSLMKSKHGKSTNDLLLKNEIKNEKYLKEQQFMERKRFQQESLNKEIEQKTNKHSISPKVTEKNPPSENNVYQYEGFGIDHQRIVEYYKALTRDKIRKKVVNVIKNESSNRNKDHLMNLDLKTCGNLTLPSFKKQFNNKNEYKKTLLDQIEADRVKRIKRREEERNRKDLNIDKLAKGAFVDQFPYKRDELKKEYNKYIRDKEKKNAERLQLKKQDEKYMDVSIENYLNRLRNDQTLEMVFIQISQ